ncbi:MAG TPA: ADP-ribosylglycohydrolase family protein [Acidimicrobiia bacterium]|nr:ADP-ribosylglycohydrolase family protein [Acidimicrobiia bacterium]
MSDAKGPLFSLVNGEGAGALLAAAAGDVAGGAGGVAYSAITQQATVVAYHLIANNGVQGSSLAREWSELAADGSNPSVYRSASPEFEEWVTKVDTGEAQRSSRPSAEPAARVAPVGVWFRRRPVDLVVGALEVSRLTHLDATTAVAAAAMAGATAASCFAQTGRDLLSAAEEISRQALALVEEEATFTNVDEARRFPPRLLAARSLVSARSGRVLSEIGKNTGPDEVLMAVALACGSDQTSDELLRVSAEAGGSRLAAMVGALVGAREGIRNWPWEVPNSTWFAEIGRRLVSGHRETRDLPVPYFVEESLTHGIDRDDHRPFLRPS